MTKTKLLEEIEELVRENSKLKARLPMNTYLVSTNGTEPKQIKIQAHYYLNYDENRAVFKTYPNHEEVATIFNFNYIKKL